MKILVLGGGGFIGRKLAEALVRRGELRGAEITGMTLADIRAPWPLQAPYEVALEALDIADRAAAARVVAEHDVIFHLAAAVSGECEANFDLGMHANLEGTLSVLEAARQAEAASGDRPVVVYTSSIAVYGGDTPVLITDWTALNPQTSYGSQKAATELILNDYARKGFIDGRGLRLPTISVRPGKANKAASSFMSSIFREPLQGQPAVCPVGPDYEHWFLSPRRVVESIIHAAEVPEEALGMQRCFAIPGNTHRIGDMVEAMRRIAGDAPCDLIRWERDPAVEAIVLGWKGRFSPEKALALGFRADESFEDNIRYFVEDDIQRA
ncbi:MAG: D-erythronate dehydrogenase [Pseudomonadota bacterium]